MTTPSTLARSFPTLKYLAAPFRWAFGTRRRRRMLALVLLAMVALPYAWWRTQLIGLPDIGDRLLPGPWRSPEVPNERNAMVLYRQAQDRYRTAGPPAKGPLDMYAPWSKTPEALRREVQVNGESLDLFRRAADRPEAGPAPDGLHLGSSMLHWLALLEASRREERGDMAGAWTWYRALLRTVHHMGAFATYDGRTYAQDRYARLRARVDRWAADPRTTPAMLHRALDDAIACAAMPAPSDAYTVATECEPLDDFEGKVNSSKWNAIFGIPEDYIPPDKQQAIYDLWRIWHREPERSRRIIRLAVANWLTYERLPANKRPPRVPCVSVPYGFYDAGPEAPAQARALSPGDLDRWLATSPEARQFLERWVRGRWRMMKLVALEKLRARERGNDRTLLVLLASELHRRDHGAEPPSEAALVGPYLKERSDDAGR